MKSTLITRILRVLLGIDLLLSGVLFFVGTGLGVDDFAQVVDRLGYPEYVLTPIGIGKLCMAMVILASGSFLWRRFAYFALEINLFFAGWSHVAAGDSLSDMAPVLVTLLFGALVALRDYREWKRGE
jgi:hypothetical protein